MSAERSDDRFPRRGSVLPVLILLFLLSGIVAGGLLWNGKKAEEAAQQKISEGLESLEAGKPEQAIESFSAAKQPPGLGQTLYRSLGLSSLNVSDLNQLMISSILVLAYERFFELSPQPDLVKKAEEALTGISGAEGQDLKTLVKTAATISALCAALGEKKYPEVMKGLLAAEKEALAEDRDFFIMEIRLLIACGKGLQSKDILGRARELLWFISSEAGIKGPKIDRLWRLLNK